MKKIEIHTDEQCNFCGYPFDLHDTAYTEYENATEIYCSPNCYELDQKNKHYEYHVLRQEETRRKIREYEEKYF